MGPKIPEGGALLMPVDPEDSDEVGIVPILLGLPELGKRVLPVFTDEDKLAKFMKHCALPHNTCIINDPENVDALIEYAKAHKFKVALNPYWEGVEGVAGPCVTGQVLAEGLYGDTEGE